MKNCLEPTGLRWSSFAAVLVVRLRELITQQLSAQGVRNTRAIEDIIVSENDCILIRWERMRRNATSITCKAAITTAYSHFKDITTPIKQDFIETEEDLRFTPRQQ